MAFNSWFSRLHASSSWAILDGFRGRALSQHRHSAPAQRALAATAAVSGGSDDRRFWLWSGALVPLEVAASAGSLAFRSSLGLSLCEAPDQDAGYGVFSWICISGGVKVGGKGSTAYLVKGSHREVPRELIGELVAICGENMTMDYEERSFHGKPQNSFHKAVNIPDVVVFPGSKEEVSKIVKSCNEHKVSIVPYGGATSIEGHTLSPNGGVCIDMTLMKVTGEYAQ